MTFVNLMLNNPCACDNRSTLHVLLKLSTRTRASVASSVKDEAVALVARTNAACSSPNGAGTSPTYSASPAHQCGSQYLFRLSKKLQLTLIKLLQTVLHTCLLYTSRCV